MGSLSLNSIVDINVQTAPPAAPRSTFDQMLIIGTATVITPEERLRYYEAADDMLDDGFVITDEEYKGALLAFSQNPAPNKVWIGRRNVASSPEESILDAFIACRAASPEWYVGVAPAAVKSDILEIAAWAEAATPPTVYAYTTADADVLTNTEGNVMKTLKGLLYDRTIGQYSTDGLDSICAIMGYAMGQNSGLANSAFTLKFKGEVGVAVEDITTTQRGYIEGANGNVYLSYGNYYNIFEQGVMASGKFFDQIINIDMLCNNIQLSVMDLLYQNPKIPQTDAGVTQLINAINQACEQAVTVGYLGGGQWTGAAVLNLKQYDTLPRGYMVQAASLSAQSTADREARKSPSIYVAIKEAGAIHSVLIGVYVNS